MNAGRSFPIPALALKRAALVLLGLALLAGLAAFAQAGSYARYWADDYCYSAAVKQVGLVQGIRDWYNTSGNRLSTLVVVALSELGGPRAVQFLPAAQLLLWLAGWVVFLASLQRAAAPRAFTTEARWLWIAVLALLMVFFTFLLTPDRLQTLYWRMGSLHYSLPLPLLLLNLSLLLRAPVRGARWWWAALASALLAFFAAGLSETFAALQLGLLLALIAAGLLWGFFTRRSQPSAVRPHVLDPRLLAFPLAGTLAMMLIMASAPANAWRQDALPPPDNLLLILPYSLRYAWDFIFYSLRGAPLPFLVFCLAVFSLCLLLPSYTISPRKAAAAAALSLLAGYALVVCAFAPSVYAGLAYPAGRAQMPGHAALLAALSAAAFFAAAGLRGTLPARRAAWLDALAVVLLLAAALYPLRALAVPRADAAQLSVRAERWDARTAQISADRAAGQVDLQVREVDVVQSLEDMGPNPNHWINRCAAVYFEVNSITALP